jgi:hypothetical protein
LIEDKDKTQANNTRLLNDYLVTSSTFGTMLANLWGVGIAEAVKATVTIIEDRGKTPLAELLKAILPKELTRFDGFEIGLKGLDGFAKKMLQASEDFKNGAIKFSEIMEAAASDECIIHITAAPQEF